MYLHANAFASPSHKHTHKASIANRASIYALTYSHLYTHTHTQMHTHFNPSLKAKGHRLCPVFVEWAAQGGHVVSGWSQASSHTLSLALMDDRLTESKNVWMCVKGSRVGDKESDGGRMWQLHTPLWCLILSLCLCLFVVASSLYLVFWTFLPLSHPLSVYILSFGKSVNVAISARLMSSCMFFKGPTFPLCNSVRHLVVMDTHVLTKHTYTLSSSPVFLVFFFLVWLPSLSLHSVKPALVVDSWLS